MGYIHNVQGTDHTVTDKDGQHFVIDAITRQITNNTGKVVLTKLDHNSECFTFEIPGEIEGHDMSDCNVVEVHYININSATREKNADVYTVNDFAVSEGKGTFTWLVSQSATQHVGTLSFAVRFACYPETEEGLDTSSTPLYSWRTGVFSGINIIDSVFSAEQAIGDYSDILESWWRKIESTHKDVYVITDEGAIINVTKAVEDMETAVDNKVAELEGKVSGFETTFNEKMSGFDTTFNELENETHNLLQDVRDASEILYPVGTLFRTTVLGGYPSIGTWELISSVPTSTTITEKVQGTTSELSQTIHDGEAMFVAEGSIDLGLGCSDVKILALPSGYVSYDEETGIAYWRLYSTSPSSDVIGTITATTTVDGPPYEYERTE